MFTYLHYTSPNGTYADWAHNHKNISYDLQSVSEWYFITSAAIFIVGPLLISLNYLIMELGCSCGSAFADDEGSLFLFTDELLKEFLSVDYITVDKHFCINFIIAIAFLPIDTIITSMFMNIILPLYCVKTAFKLACTNESNEDTFTKSYTRTKITVFKGYELFMETLPQFVLGLVFIRNNYPFVRDCNPLTLVSVIFSGVSLCLGILNWCKAYCCD